MEKIVEDVMKRIEDETREKKEAREKKFDPIDEELEDLLTKLKTNISVVGTGGAGGNTVTRIMEAGIEGAETICINTDAQDLLYTKSHHKLLIGREVTQGLGAGNVPLLGEEAAKENEPEIKALLQGSDMVFVTCGLGGGTGTGSAPIIAQIAKKLGALTVAVVTLPFTIEGIVRKRNAQEGLSKLMKVVDTAIVIPNDKLLKIVPNFPINAAFKVADEILMQAVKGITEMITKPGLVNLDFADVKAVVKDGGLAMMGIGDSDSDNRALDSVNKAIVSPLLDIDISGAKGALINITGGDDLSVEESEKIINVVASKLDPEATIIWGAQIDPSMDRNVRTMVVVTGVKYRDIYEEEHLVGEADIGTWLGLKRVE
ncbi:MAG: cell division protein FtsZ [Candidatus Hydrothermarchaeota archaeon]